MLLLEWLLKQCNHPAQGRPTSRYTPLGVASPSSHKTSTTECSSTAVPCSVELPLAAITRGATSSSPQCPVLLLPPAVAFGIAPTPATPPNSRRQRSAEPTSMRRPVTDSTDSKSVA